MGGMNGTAMTITPKPPSGEHRVRQLLWVLAAEREPSFFARALSCVSRMALAAALPRFDFGIEPQ